MNEKLQQAIAAARDGQSTEAQLLLTQLLQEDPNDVQAWFLLSNLVDSEQKKTAYLGKVLALDPQHEMAAQALARLQTERVVEEAVETETETETETAVIPDEPDLPAQPTELDMPAISTDSIDLMAQEAGDTVPAWLAEEGDLDWEQLESEDIELESVLEPEESVEVPDWLQEDAEKTWEEEAAPDEAEPAADEPVESKPADVVVETAVTDKDGREKQLAALKRIQTALTIAAVIVIIILLYLVGQTIF